MTVHSDLEESNTQDEPSGDDEHHPDPGDSGTLPPPMTGQADIVPAPTDKQPSLELPPNYKPIPIPDAPAISQSLLLARALRPLARQIAIGLPTILDEAETVDFVAETGLWQPVLKAESEIWLDVALVFDTSPSMCLWQRLGADLYRLLARAGEFRDVHIWRLDHQKGKVHLTTRRGEVRKPRELLIGDRRRLIVIVSDCVAPAWHNGQMRDLISVWSAKLPTVIFQVFPERLWSRTALARSVIVELRGKQEGVPSDQLQPIARSVWDEDRLQKSLEQPRVRLPVVTLERDSLFAWAKVIAGDRRSRVLGIVWDAPPTKLNVTAKSSSESTPALKDQLDSFVLTASPLARKLAELLASAPVITLPIVRLIKQANLNQASAVHMAEVLMSGLLKVSGDRKPTFENVERVVYELVDDAVRDRLREGSLANDALTVYNKVSEYVAQGLGKSVSEFWALLRIPALGSGSEETEFLDAFASVTAKILRGLGGEFEAIADSLTPIPVPAEEVIEATDDFPIETFEYEVAEFINFPPFEPFNFIEAQFDEDAFPPPLQAEEFTIITFEVQQDAEDNEGLESFEFTVATLERQDLRPQRQRQEQITEWEILRQQQLAYRFIEPLPGDIPLEMVAIPAGTFLMGSPDDELARNEEREGPQHEVAIEPFFMGRYPVTQAQWRVVAAMPEVTRKLDRDPSRFKGDNRPVEKVSWDDAVEFCARLSAHTGREYRLPSEAEWEYACRAGTTTPFHFGETISSELADYHGTTTYADGPRGEHRGETTAVDQFDVANAFGLTDMHGNVFEWCQDHWHSNYDGAPTDGSAWQEGGDLSNRVRRGGSWVSLPRACRSASRSSYNPGLRGYVNGFRVCCTASRKQATAPRT